MQHDWGVDIGLAKTNINIQITGKKSRSIKRQLGKTIDCTGEGTVPITTESTYLGTMIGPSITITNLAISDRINKANAAMHRTAKVWKCTAFTLNKN